MRDEERGFGEVGAVKKLICRIFGHRKIWVISWDPWAGKIWVQGCRRCYLREDAWWFGHKQKVSERSLNGL